MSHLRTSATNFLTEILEKNSTWLYLHKGVYNHGYMYAIRTYNHGTSNGLNMVLKGKQNT